MGMTILLRGWLTEESVQYTSVSGLLLLSTLILRSAIYFSLKPAFALLVLAGLSAAAPTMVAHIPSTRTDGSYCAATAGALTGTRCDGGCTGTVSD